MRAETPLGDPRGYIQTERLREVWFHTGTICNLSCPFCLEGSGPGNDRLQVMEFADAQPLIDEAVTLGVAQFSFTGGEPFVTRDIVRILDYALERGPCLVLTNATKPLRKRLHELEPLLAKPHPLSFRVSLDYPDPDRHDRARGEGSFRLALETLGLLHEMGFHVSVARQRVGGEIPEQIEAAYTPYLREVGIEEQLTFISFPDLMPPGSHPEVPHITQDCMTRYHTAETRASFMCSFSRMVVKRAGQVRVYACTLVDDDDEYDLAPTLTESIVPRILMAHHRCYSCFALGASCSES